MRVCGWVWVCGCGCGCGCVCVCARAQCVCASGVPVALGPMTYKFRNTSLYLKGSGIVPIPVLSIFLAVCSIFPAGSCHFNCICNISNLWFSMVFATCLCYLQHFGGICNMLVLEPGSNCSCNMVVRNLG